LSDFSTDPNGGVSTLHHRREPTKLECGLLGALTATVVLGVLFWIGIQISVLNLMVHLG
jgi:hypothetical protein